MIDAVISPSMLSDAVAPASKYVVPTSTMIGVSPSSVMTGGVVSTSGVVSTTLTVLIICVAALSEESITS